MKTNIWIKFSRLGKLLWWLVGASRAMHQLNDARQRDDVMRFWAQRALNILGVRVEHDGLPEITGGALIAANHVSWLDILAITARYPSSFIAMKELETWWVVGKMIAHSGAVFIDRKNRKDIEPINASIAQTLQAGGRVCFFPEARTSLGNNVLPLKAALFESALKSQKAVVPLALRYYAENQRTQLVTFSDTPFLVSLWRILSVKEIVVRLDVGEAILPNELPEADRFILKEKVELFLKNKVLSDSPNPSNPSESI